MSQSSQAKNIAKGDNFLEIKTFLKNIGSNFLLSDKKFSFETGGGWKILAEKLPNSNWLRDLDSNQDTGLQRPMSFH